MGVIEIEKKFEGEGVEEIIYKDIESDGVMEGIKWD